MCSFVTTNRKVRRPDSVNFYSRFRGPDATTVRCHEGVTYIHNLLSITGAFREQPLVDAGGDVLCVFNGEIYNHADFGDFESDGGCLLPLYRRHGPAFTRHLDGEFAIALVDYAKRTLLISTDVFATKPLWFGTRGGSFGATTYESSLRALGIRRREKVPANTTRVYSLDDLRPITEFRLREFDLDQHKRTYDDWVRAFQASIRKRSQGAREKIFIGLSGGMDSGMIARELAFQDVPYKAFTLVAEENLDIVRRRTDFVPCHEMMQVTAREYEAQKKLLKRNGEYFEYVSRFRKYVVHKDKGAIGTGLVCQRAREQGYKIYLSGHGADEIVSDYGWRGEKRFPHSEFGGLFPADLREIFPWESFYGGTQIQYMYKDEAVGGFYGIECRYPFLDPALVQEFLWLDQELKNRHYKAPLHHYLELHDVPYDGRLEAKVGFRAGKNLKAEHG